MSTITQNYSGAQQANKAYQSAFQHGSAPIPPARKLAVVTCMDARLHPESFLGLNVGDAHVIRNAGGRIDPGALRSLVISQRLLGTEEVGFWCCAPALQVSIASQICRGEDQPFTLAEQLAH